MGKGDGGRPGSSVVGGRKLDRRKKPYEHVAGRDADATTQLESRQARRAETVSPTAREISLPALMVSGAPAATPRIGRSVYGYLLTVAALRLTVALPLRESPLTRPV